MVSGWISEEPSLAREECLQLGRSESTTRVGRLLHRFMPGDSHRDLQHATELHDESLDLVLLPVWIFSIRYHERKPPIRILVNGQTGKVGGTIPTSWAKVLKIAAVVLGILSESEEALDAEVESLIKAREAARDERDWAKSDEIREKLLEMGIILEDTPSGTVWKRV